MKVGSLGNVVFETSDKKILTPLAFKSTCEPKYKEHEGHGGMPRSEFIHAGISSIEMSIVLRSDFGLDPISEANLLKAYCNEGKVLRLILAGINLGKFTLRSFSEEWKYLHHGQGPQHIKVDITLMEYI